MMRDSQKVILGILAAVCVFVLTAANSANVIWDIGVGNVASFNMFGAGLVPVDKHGINADLDTGEESIWDADDLPTEGDGPARCFVNVGTTPIDFYVSSDNAADATLEISLDIIGNDWAASTVTMDLGATAASSGTVYTQIGASTLLRVNRAHATDDAFTGNIYIHTDVADTGTDGVPDIPATQIVAVITAGENKTQQACLTVPLGFSFGMNQDCTSNVTTPGTRSVTYRIRSSTNGGAPLNNEQHQVADGVYRCTPHNPPIVFVEKTDIEITGVSTGADAVVGATFDGILFPSSFF